MEKEGTWLICPNCGLTTNKYKQLRDFGNAFFGPDSDEYVCPNCTRCSIPEDWIETTEVHTD